MRSGIRRNCKTILFSTAMLYSSHSRYLKKIDSFQNNHIHTFITGGNVKFMLLMNPDPAATAYSSFQASPPSRPSTARQSTLIANNPSSQQTEDAVRQFMSEVRHPAPFTTFHTDISPSWHEQVYEAWMKCIMNPFYATDQPVTSPVFRSRVSTAAKKYL